MTVTLDCENQSSTLKSISNIYDIEPEILEIFLKNFDLENHSKMKAIRHTYDCELQIELEKQLKCKPQNITCCYWFHLSRTLPDEDFSEGILPLSICLEKVWETIYKVFKGTPHEQRLYSMQTNGSIKGMYTTKLECDQGPYAMLVAESAYRPNEVGNYDYLNLPEIMRDICNAYENKYKISLHNELKQNLTPKIVKFKTKSNIKQYILQTALYYLYNTFKNQKLSHLSNTTFDGEKNTILPHQIVKIIDIKKPNKSL